MITFDNVSYRYANTDHDAVRNISFTVKPGELKIVTGASGCGKTTLMRLTNGLAPQVYGGTVTGSVTVAGKNVSQTPVAELAEDIGTLFQDPEEQFFALNVGNEIAFALRSRGVPADAITERVDAAARRVGIESLVKQDIHALSEGQKQKVGLADILALGPKVLILDEPSANLDPETTAALAQTLIELKHQGCAILVVDHRLYWLRDAADAVKAKPFGERREVIACKLFECNIAEVCAAHIGVRLLRICNALIKTRDTADIRIASLVADGRRDIARIDTAGHRDEAFRNIRTTENTAHAFGAEDIAFVAAVCDDKRARLRAADRRRAFCCLAACMTDHTADAVCRCCARIGHGAAIDTVFDCGARRDKSDDAADIGAA
ncbi:MAG: ABC transporter ATP-binding protein [Sutterella sp.]|nr:ABC transporter ATP-binding protein [Sutterella sp.]